MKSLGLSTLVGARTAALLLALSVYIAIVLQIEQNLSPVYTEQEGPESTDQKPAIPGQDGPDSSSFMQSLLGISHSELSGSTPSLKQEPLSKWSKDHPATSWLRTWWQRPGKIGAQMARAANALRIVFHSSSTSLLEQAHQESTTNAGSMAIVVILALLVCVFLYLMLAQWMGGSRRPQGAPPQNKDTSSMSQASGFYQDVLPHMRPGAAPSNLSLRGTPLQGTSRTPPPWSPLPSSTALGSLSQLPSSLWAPPAPEPQLPAEVDKRALPPPLCPNVILPNCEVRVGVPMHELGRITSEGDLGIVGLSGNPLLRASLRKNEAGRTLEISMPEPRSAPRAIVGPSFQEVIGPAGKSRAVQILGMKGAFYGMLEMRSSGACYVIKDGQTVLIIDGDSDKLHLSINSGLGSQLASVTCSSEPFGGAEHLEIRVQPGVDTVLVLACVLAVVLLSPYPPSD